MGQSEEERPAPGAGTVVSVEPFEAFFDRLLPRAIRLGTSILGSRTDGEDAAIEGLARAYIAWERIGSLSYRDAWALRVTANVSYDQVRREIRRERHEPLAASQAETTDVVDLRRTLVPLLRRLSARQREVVILNHIVGLSHEEIAALLGCSVGSVKVHARRGLEKLRAGLAPGTTAFEED